MMKLLVSALKRALFIITLYAGISIAPDVSDVFIRNYVGSQTFKVTNAENMGSGTGWVLRLPNGSRVLMTNAHVCEGVRDASPTRSLRLKQGDKTFKSKIIRVFPKADLCAMTAPEGYHGLYTASEAYIGQQVWVVGHPKGAPLTVSSGYTQGISDMTVAYDIVAKAELCPRGSKAEPAFFSFYCTKTRPSMNTNVIILPGNSGSAVVDRFGMVVGVVYAGSSESNWGSYVPYNFLDQFIQDLSK